MIMDIQLNKDSDSFKEYVRQKYSHLQQRSQSQLKIQDNKSKNSTRYLDEYANELKTQRSRVTNMDTLAEDTAKLNTQIDKYEQAIQSHDKKNDKVKKDIQEVDVKLESINKLVNGLDRVEQFLGIHIELTKQTDVFNVKLTCLPISDSKKEFKFQILVKNDVKILMCDPPGCIDPNELEDQIQVDQLRRDKLFKTILQIRKRLIVKYRN